jgi:hypothetical protein
MLIVAMLLAAAAPQPWLAMSAGPVFLRQGGGQGMSTGPLVRLEVGYPVGDRLAASAWLSGLMQSAPEGAPGDRALLGAGIGGRVLVLRTGSEDSIGFWLNAGAGWGAPLAGSGGPGLTGFGGALVTWNPFVKRFTLGLEADAIAWRSAFGLAVLPTLRCSF